MFAVAKPDGGSKVSSGDLLNAICTEQHDADADKPCDLQKAKNGSQVTQCRSNRYNTADANSKAQQINRRGEDCARLKRGDTDEKNPKPTDRFHTPAYSILDDTDHRPALCRRFRPCFIRLRNPGKPDIRNHPTRDNQASPDEAKWSCNRYHKGRCRLEQPVEYDSQNHQCRPENHVYDDVPEYENRLSLKNELELLNLRPPFRASGVHRRR